jgi:hypothetical protein
MTVYSIQTEIYLHNGDVSLKKKGSIPGFQSDIRLKCLYLQIG